MTSLDLKCGENITIKCCSGRVNRDDVQVNNLRYSSYDPQENKTSRYVGKKLHPVSLIHCQLGPRQCQDTEKKCPLICFISYLSTGTGVFLVVLFPVHRPSLLSLGENTYTCHRLTSLRWHKSPCKQRWPAASQPWTSSCPWPGPADRSAGRAEMGSAGALRDMGWQPGQSCRRSCPAARLPAGGTRTAPSLLPSP